MAYTPSPTSLTPEYVSRGNINITRIPGSRVGVTCPTDSQLTVLRDEHSALLSGLAFGRTLSYGVDLAGRSLADLFALRRLRTGKSPHTTEHTYITCLLYTSDAADE